MRMSADLFDNIAKLAVRERRSTAKQIELAIAEHIDRKGATPENGMQSDRNKR